MFAKVSVLVPTRGRPNRLRALIASYVGTVWEAGEAELVFRADADDWETFDLLRQYNHSVIVGPRYDGYKSMPVFFNEMAAVATGDVLMCGNDDMVFKTTGWPTLVLAVANRYPDGVFDIGVDTLNETHYPFSIVSRLAVERMGFIWDPRIFWGDIFLRDVMAAFGRCVMLPSVQIDHDWAGHKPDKVFMESDKDIMRRDPTYWTGTHATAVNEAVVKLRGLFADQTIEPLRAESLGFAYD